MSYLLNVQIAPEDLKILRDAGYNLCFTQGFADGDVEFQGNVVFQAISSDRLAPYSQVRWQEQYQAYMTQHFMPGEVAKPDTEVYDMFLGQKIKFDKDGRGQYDRGMPGSIGFENNWKNGGRFGIKLRVDSGDLPYENIQTTYISYPTHVGGTNAFRPVNAAGVFFNRDYKTAGTMIDPQMPGIFSVRFDRGTAATILFSDGQWKQLPM